jgi:Sec-independent protein translocase protein TatA
MDYISDPGVRTNSGAPLMTPWTPSGMSEGRYASLTAAAAHKAKVDASVARAEQSPAFKTSSSAQDFVRQRIEGIKKRLQILKKLFADDPKQMARALAQVFRELRAALKDYKAAGGQAFDASDASASEATQPQTETPEKATDEKAGGDAAAPDPGPAKAAATYAEVDQGIRNLIGQDGLSFLRDLGGLANEIEDKMLARAHIQAKARKPDKDTDEAMKDADEALKDLRKDMDDMRADIGRNAPAAGRQLSVAA